MASPSVQVVPPPEARHGPSTPAHVHSIADHRCNRDRNIHGLKRRVLGRRVAAGPLATSAPGRAMDEDDR